LRTRMHFQHPAQTKKPGVSWQENFTHLND
jgi:hypothetical protein